MRSLIWPTVLGWWIGPEFCCTNAPADRGPFAVLILLFRLCPSLPPILLTGFWPIAMHSAGRDIGQSSFLLTASCHIHLLSPTIPHSPARGLWLPLRHPPTMTMLVVCSSGGQFTGRRLLQSSNPYLSSNSATRKALLNRSSRLFYASSLLNEHFKPRRKLRHNTAQRRGVSSVSRRKCHTLNPHERAFVRWPACTTHCRG